MGIISKTAKRLFYDKKEKRHELVGPPKLWKMKQKFQIDFLKEMGLKPQNTLLDIGCGTLRGGIPIIQFLEEEKYFGIDVREKVIEEAFKELREEKLEHKKPNIEVFSDFKELNYEHSFDIIFAFSVLIHMSDDIAENCIRFASTKLTNDGMFCANVNIGDRKDGNWQGYPIVFRSFKFYQKIASKYNLHVEDLGTLKSLGHDTQNQTADCQIMLKFTQE